MAAVTKAGPVKCNGGDGYACSGLFARVGSQSVSWQWRRFGQGGSHDLQRSSCTDRRTDWNARICPALALPPLLNWRGGGGEGRSFSPLKEPGRQSLPVSRSAILVHGSPNPPRLVPRIASLWLRRWLKTWLLSLSRDTY